MALKRLSNILFLLLFTILQLSAQSDFVRCINPRFDKTVDSYLSYTVPTISVADAWEQKSRFIFLDARENEEYKTSHIEGAVHIGYDNFELSNLEGISKDSRIIVYCSIGYRSEKIGEQLRRAGYKNVLNLYGSIFEWVNQHHPVINQDGKETNAVHTYNKKWSKWIQAMEIDKVYE